MRLALDALFAHEHAMTDDQREMARCQLWLRDYPDDPLPADRARLRLCTCRQCLFARRLGRLSQVISTPGASDHIPASIVKQPSAPQCEAAQGDLFSYFS
jgi:hypothetical protein